MDVGFFLYLRPFCPGPGLGGYIFALKGFLMGSPYLSLSLSLSLPPPSLPPSLSSSLPLSLSPFLLPLSPPPSPPPLSLALGGE